MDTNLTGAYQAGFEAGARQALEDVAAPLKRQLDGSDLTEICERHGWHWRENAEYPGLFELADSDHKMLAWIQKRPDYCDRGHWQLNCEISGLDCQDGFPRYFMRLITAKNEAVRFLAWRLHKEHNCD